jgi:hypothetical protein
MSLGVLDRNNTRQESFERGEISYGEMATGCVVDGGVNIALTVAGGQIVQKGGAAIMSQKGAITTMQQTMPNLIRVGTPVVAAMGGQQIKAPQAPTTPVPATTTVSSSQKQTRSKAEILQANKQQGAQYEKTVKKQAQTTQTDVVDQVTVKTKSGVKTRIDVVGTDVQSGQVKLTEAKSSSTAPLTTNQKQAYPEIAESGATVVGKGKAPYTGGTPIPPTMVDVVRPE